MEEKTSQNQYEETEETLEEKTSEEQKSESNELKSALKQKEHWKKKYNELKNSKETKKKTSKKSTGEKKTPKKQGFDYAQKSYLLANGIKKDEFQLVENIVSETGKDIDDVLESKYFQAELKDYREQKASEDAVPEGKKRGSGTGRDSVEYWLAKGEMPPIDQPELRRQYVNAKIKKAEGGSHFTDQPIGNVKIK